MGETSLLADVGLLIVGLVGLLVPGVRVLSCFAVMPTYLDAREPGVMIGSTAAVLGSGTVLLGVVAGFERVLADPPPGVRLPIEADGVILPDCDAGVIRPLEIEDTLLPFVLIEDENEGVALPDNEGVTRPLRLEATDEGLEIDTAQDVEGESLEVAMNTPQFGGQVKYRFPPTEPSFFPLPAKPPPSSTPANVPAFPSISPRKRRVPSNPSDSMRTVSPSS